MKGILTSTILLWPILVTGTLAEIQTPAGERDDSASVDPDGSPLETPAPGSPPRWERDNFSYVVAGRRDPFLPAPFQARPESVASLDAEVLGIISHADPRLSVAVVRVARGRADEGGVGAGVAGGTYRVRLGDRIENMRILSIRERQVVVEVEGPAGIERRILEQPAVRRGAR